MKQYVVEITTEALLDMEEIYDYIANALLSSKNARGQYNRIAERILGLEFLPERFQIMDTELGFSKGLRRMLVDNYSVFYIIENDRVIVTNVLYSASDIENRLRG